MDNYFEVRCNVVQHNLALLIYLMRITQSLINNPTVNLEHEVLIIYLHQYLSIHFSCIWLFHRCCRVFSVVNCVLDLKSIIIGLYGNFPVDYSHRYAGISSKLFAYYSIKYHFVSNPYLFNHRTHTIIARLLTAMFSEGILHVLIYLIITLSNRSYHIGDVRERITKILIDAYRSVNSSNATLYGALYALMELGYSEVWIIIVTNMC
jgi:hypothetical protein